MTARATFSAVSRALALALLATSAFADTDAPRSLRGRIGVDAAEALLASRSVSDRLRGLSRLGEAGTPRAVARLERALEPGGSATTAKERLTAVRALAESTADPDACRALVRVLGGHATPSSTEEPAPLDVLAEESAALALARAGTKDALAALGKALSSPGRAARSAHKALVAHPPADLSVVLAAAGLSTVALAEALSDLANPQAAPRLRALVLGGSEPVRAIAAVALGRLGDVEAIPLARKWGTNGTGGVLRVAGARILAEHHEKDAPSAIAALLGAEDTANGAVALALEFPDPALVPALAPRLGRTLGRERADVITAIGKTGSKEAVLALVAALARPETAIRAADALARMDDGDAEKAIAAALAVPATRRIAARAAAIRHAVLGGRVAGTDAATAELARSKVAADRAVAATLRAVLDERRLSELATEKDVAVITSLAPLAFLGNDSATLAAVGRLEHETNTTVATALSFVLGVGAARDHVPTRVLTALLDANASAAPLAAEALAARDEERLRPTLLALLSSERSALREALALGLGDSDRPDATGLLESAYRFETDPGVRRAIVHALRQRPGTRGGSVALAAALDPDPLVREEATRTAPEKPQERIALWLEIPRGDTAPGITTVSTHGGLSLPVVAAEDGQAIVIGLPGGGPTVEVAPREERDDHSTRGESGDEKDNRVQGS